MAISGDDFRLFGSVPMLADRPRKHIRRWRPKQRLMETNHFFMRSREESFRRHIQVNDESAIGVDDHDGRHRPFKQDGIAPREIR